MLIKNSNDTIGYRTHDLPACSAVPQPSTPPRTPIFLHNSCFCRSENLRFNRSWQWTVCIVQLCDSDRSIGYTIKHTNYQLSS